MDINTRQLDVNFISFNFNKSNKRKEGKMGMRQVKAPGGYILEKDENNNIRAIISPMGKKIKVGQRVISNGRFYLYGVGGIMMKIYPPYTGHWTSDVVEVLFVFDGKEIPVSVKFKDLL